MNAEANENCVSIRILQTTDLHAHIYAFNYDTDRRVRGYGMSLAGRVIEAQRASCPENTVLFDSGDFLQGTLLGDGLQSGQPPQQNPVIMAMNDFGYDAVTLGNHEFSFGYDYLTQVLKQATFPIVTSNAEFSGDLQRRILPWMIIDRKLRSTDGQEASVRIGVVGFLPSQTTEWESHAIRDQVTIDDMVKAASKTVPQVIKAGADIVVALCHSGLSSDEHRPPGESAAAAVAQVPGVDAVLAGHVHGVFPGPDFINDENADLASGTLYGVPAVMAGRFGSHVGQIDLTLAQTNGRWRPVGHRVEVLHTSGLPVGTAPLPFSQSVQAAHEVVVETMRQPVAIAKSRIHSFFGLSGADPVLSLLARAQKAEAARLLQGREEAKLPLLSSVAPFKVGGRGGPWNYIDIAPGTITLRHVLQLYPFPDALAVVEATGAQVREWLEQAAGVFVHARPGETTGPLIVRPGYCFDVIHGLTYEVALDQPARYDSLGRLRNHNHRRIVDLRYQGQPVADEDRFAVATNSFRIGGGVPITQVAKCRSIDIERVKMRDVILRYVKAHSPLNGTVQQVWKFAPVPGAVIHCRTGIATWETIKASHPIASQFKAAGPVQDGFLPLKLYL